MKIYLLSLLLSISFISSVSSLDLPDLTSPVIDQAKILSPADLQKLESILYSVKKNSGPQIQVLTVKTLQGLTIEDFSIEVVDKWQLGNKERDDGLLLLVSTGDKKVRIEVGDGLEGVMTDYRSGEIIDKIIKNFKDGKMDVGIFVGVAETLNTLGVDVNKLKINSFISNKRSRYKRSNKKYSIFDIISGLIFFLFFIFGKSRRRVGYISSRSGFSSGGFSSGGGSSWSGGTISDNESNLNSISYTLSNNGSANYIVDSINPSDTEFVIYVKEGDVIKFEATTSVTSNHPFKMSTVQNATNGDSGQIGTAEGWNQDTMTLTVSSSTPDTIYPYCDFHSGMYSQGKIVKVSSYTQANIDITSVTSALQVKGTVATGPFKGASGYTYKVYLNSQGGSEHTHTFHEYPGLTFYMPADQGYHGSETSSTDTPFKAKSHYSADSDDGGSDSY